LQTVIEDPNIVKKAIEILCRQSDGLKYGADDFVCSESFVDHFNQTFDYDYVQLVDDEERIEMLGFNVLHPRPPEDLLGGLSSRLAT
jgi:hypothetical protein